jgi:hypothetical protein
MLCRMMIMNDEWELVWGEIFVAYFKILRQNLPEDPPPQKKSRNFLVRTAGLQSRIDPDASQIRRRSTFTNKLLEEAWWVF